VKHLRLFEEFSEKDCWAVYLCVEKTTHPYKPESFKKVSAVTWKHLGEIEVRGIFNNLEKFEVYISNLSSKDWVTNVMYYDVREDVPSGIRTGIINVADKFTMGSDGEIGKAIVRILSFEDNENANRETLLSLYPNARGQIGGKTFGF
jgi:hypothetical protein